MWTTLIAGLGILAAAIFPAASQDAPRATERAVHGIVIDSVAGAPLSGATVQVAVVGAAGAPRTATTDVNGFYRVAGLTPGQYVVGFYHEALTALGLDAPMRVVDLSGDTEVTADLAVPSVATIRTLRCGESPAFATGMLVGFVRDAETRAGIASTTAIVRWRAFALDSANYRVVEERVTVTVDADGAILGCHLPVDVPLDLHVHAPGHRGVDGTVLNIPSSGIGQLDLRLADSARTTGTAIVRGEVRRESGKAIEFGRVVIKALDREVAVQNGTFTAGNLPAGTWVAEARVIGVEPREVLVTAVDSTVVTTAITVSDTPQRLDAVTVVGKMDRNLRVLDEVLRRKRIGMGTTFLPGHPALKSALFVADVLKEARGFRYAEPYPASARPGCVAVYLDGDPVPGGFENLEDRVSMREVLAIETWPNRQSTPIIFQYGFGFSNPLRPHVRSSACATVAVWTIRRF